MAKEVATATPTTALTVVRRFPVDLPQVMFALQILGHVFDFFSNRKKSARDQQHAQVLRRAVLKKIRALKAAQRKADIPAEKRKLEKQIRALLSLVTED